MTTTFNCTTEKGIIVPNKQPEGFSATVTNLSGMTLNGKTAYFVKNNSTINKSALYVYPDYTTTKNASVYPLEGDGVSFGMHFFNNYVFIAFGNEIRQFFLTKNNIGKHRRTYPLSYTIRGITVFEDRLFLVLDAKSSAEPTKLHFRILDCSVGTTAREVGDFYVECEKECRLQDIHYNTYHGLFIATNDMDYSTCKNTILRVDLTDLYRRLDEGKTISGETVPVASKWAVNLSTNVYKQCNVESLHITDSGELMVCCNVSAKSGQGGLTKDGTLKIANFKFRTDGRGIEVKTTRLQDIPKTGDAHIPGALAVNGKKAYVYLTETGSNKETYLLYAEDYRTDAFKVVSTKLTKKGHCNGAAYYNNSLYSCDYIRADKKHDIGIFDLNNDDFSDINNAQEVPTGEKNIYGAIAYYKDGEFLLVDYGNPETGAKNYAIEIHVDKGRFNKDSAGNYSYSCTAENYLVIDNPMYTPQVTKGPLQDAYYEPGIGLFIGGYVVENNKEIDYLMRIDIDSYINAGRTEHISPTEIYLLRYKNKAFEIESPAMSEEGELLIAGNTNDSGKDTLVKTTDLTFV